MLCERCDKEEAVVHLAGGRRDCPDPGERAGAPWRGLVASNGGGPGRCGRGKQRLPDVSVRLSLVWHARVRGVGHRRSRSSWTTKAHNTGPACWHRDALTPLRDFAVLLLLQTAKLRARGG
jgi:hypothetical protein